MRALIAKLDVQPTREPATTGNIWVVHLKNADATKLATVLRRRSVRRGGGARRQPAARTNVERHDGRPARRSAPTRQELPEGGRRITAGDDADHAVGGGRSTGGFIQADPSTNSLIITAPEPLYRHLRTVIDQLDAAPRAGLHRGADRRSDRRQRRRIRLPVAGPDHERRQQQRARRRYQLRHHGNLLAITSAQIAGAGATTGTTHPPALAPQPAFRPCSARA